MVILIFTIATDITGIRLSLFIADSRSLCVAVLSHSYAIYSDLLIIIVVIIIYYFIYFFTYYYV